ncbi:hypothetical protein ASE19_07635 [Nocardioides sp. Root79]|nr:hypothetical protein ASE19_07635 [Nocardioides sp. Root79]KRC71279.1 hypothetical protein ASE20_10050 [Nocardioides sp. Root240]
MLMTVGSSMALFAPFYFLTRSLDHHLDQLEERTAEQVEQVRAETADQVEQVRTEAAENATALTEQVAALRADVDQRLSDVNSEVQARLAAQSEATGAAFAALRSDASREAVWEALNRAGRQGLVTYDRPPRVAVRGSSPRLYVSFAVDGASVLPLRIRIEEINGRALATVFWPESASAVDVLVNLGTALAQHTPASFDVAALFSGLADLLEVARADHDQRKAIELCPPQWVVCDWGVVAYDQPGPYGVNLKALRHQYEHVSQKPWLDADAWDRAYEAALQLFPKETMRPPAPRR